MNNHETSKLGDYKMMEVTYFMQLIYLWLDMKSRGIENLELQLSPNHHCKFDCEQKELKIEYDAKMLNIFSEKYSNIKNISVIVGENGCGKTTILEEMFDLLRYDSLSSIYSNFAVVKLPINY